MSLRQELARARSFRWRGMEKDLDPADKFNEMLLNILLQTHVSFQ